MDDDDVPLLDLYYKNGLSLSSPLQEHAMGPEMMFGIDQVSHPYLNGDVSCTPPLSRAAPSHLPSVCWEDMLVPFVPVSFHHLARMRVGLLLGRVVDQADVLGHPKVKQGTGLPASLGLDELVEGVVLREDNVLLLHTHTQGEWVKSCIGGSAAYASHMNNCCDKSAMCIYGIETESEAP